jgi:uroporphyrinogen decarboxylase
MNKRDTMLSLLEPSYNPEMVPAAFFLHFDPSFHRGQSAVDKHLEFFRFTGMDMVKIQFEHRMPPMDIQRPKDWANVPMRGKEFWEEPLTIVKGLVQAAKKDAVVVLTLYSPFMLAGQIAGADTVVRHIQENPEAFKKGISIIMEGLLVMVRECAALGLDGFYTSTQGGEKGRLIGGWKSFDDCIRPFDLALMSEVNRSFQFNILHVCDYHLPYEDISPFTSYPGHIVNTSLKLAAGQLSAGDVSKMFNRPFMGGLDRKGLLARGPASAIQQEVHKLLVDAPPRFILGADCTVPSGTPWENLRVAIQTAHEHRR